MRISAALSGSLFYTYRLLASRSILLVFLLIFLPNFSIYTFFIVIFHGIDAVNF